ncbi:MAG: glycosyltransferase [Clostridiales bacterium]|nr:glycosyltransferase [Clostridiales bacterium]
MGTIFQAIDSVLKQDYGNIQIIIADDCSANFDESAIREYVELNKKDNITDYKVYRNAENLGTVKNINGAIKAASGEIIINLAADDLLYSEHTVTEIVNEFEQSGCNILCTSRAVFSDSPENVIGYMPNDYERRQIKKFKTPKQQCAAIYTGRFYNMASGSAFSYRKDYVEKLGYFDEQYRLWEDGPFFVKSILNDGLLHYNYDIISIYYRWGGISTGEGNPILRADGAKFIQIGLQEGRVKGISKRILKASRFGKRFKGKKFLRRLVKLFLYPDVYFVLLTDKLRFLFYKTFHRKGKTCK